MNRLSIIGVFVVVSSSCAAGPRVDLNQDNGRRDVLSPGWDNWRIPEKDAATAKFGEIKVSLRAVGPNAHLATGWWKPGFDYPARMVSDGVSVAGKLTCQ